MFSFDQYLSVGADASFLSASVLWHARPVFRRRVGSVRSKDYTVHYRINKTCELHQITDSWRCCGLSSGQVVRKNPFGCAWYIQRLRYGTRKHTYLGHKA